MPFQSMTLPTAVKFNSKMSSELLELYESKLMEEYRAERERPAHCTFAPSSFRCDRISYFRLKGVQPDRDTRIDPSLEFTAEIGTAIHRIIQERLKKWLGSTGWLDVGEYLQNFDHPYVISDVTRDESGLESQIICDMPPIRFAVDGLISLDHDPWNPVLLEIKTSEYSSFQQLTEPKPQHIDQVKLYSTILGLSRVLFLYVDRQYGGMKSFEIKVSSLDKQHVQDKIAKVMSLIDYNICPSKLPDNDPWCTSSMCKYYNTCKQF